MCRRGHQLGLLRPSTPSFPQSSFLPTKLTAFRYRIVPRSNMSSTHEPVVPVAVSCPAKVLVAGGYLVLDRDYTGLVFGLDARIHTVIEPLKTTAGVSISEIVVRSPQFQGAIWEYGYRSASADGGIAVTQLSVGHEQSIAASRNPFIETALSYALTYIWSLQPNQLIASSSIRILADQAYYSNPGRRKRQSVDLKPGEATSRFLDFNVTLKNAHKTGLGSSAALVTSFTAAVLSFYLPKELFDLHSEKGQTVLHNLAQASHCYAQGKVGSGFDIASAVYGSCLYRRFSPSLLAGIPIPGDIGFATALKTLVEGNTWDTEIRKAAISMPKGLRLVMCDVDCGSETPGMVKQVLKWREENKDHVDSVWNVLQAGNDALAAELTRLATANVTEKEGKPDYDKLRNILMSNRGLIRQMSTTSGVPIEPPQQTELLDFCSKQEGVVGGVVPGAGGFDAIVLFVENNDTVVSRLKMALSQYKPVDTGKGPKIDKVGVIGVREDMVGVREENLSLYQEWVTAS